MICIFNIYGGGHKLQKFVKICLCNKEYYGYCAINFHGRPILAFQIVEGVYV